MIVGMKKKRAIRLALAAAILIAPLARAQESDRTQIAAAIGAEEPAPPAPKPTAPATLPTTPPQTTAEAPKPTSVEPPAEEGFTQAEIWLGVGVAAFLAAVGGGSSTTSH